MADIYLLFREAVTASGAAHLVAAFTDRQAAIDDIFERNRQDLETSGRYSLGRFEVQPDELLPLSGVLQTAIDDNAAQIGSASGTLQDQVDLARYQLSLSFGGGTTPGFTSSSSEYELASTFPYPGSDNIVNPPTTLICYASMNQANKDGAIRVYDATNDQTVGEAMFTGNTAIEQQNVPMSGLPASGATFEVHIKRVTSGGAISLYSATIF